MRPPHTGQPEAGNPIPPPGPPAPTPCPPSTPTPCPFPHTRPHLVHNQQRLLRVLHHLTQRDQKRADLVVHGVVLVTCQHVQPHVHARPRQLLLAAPPYRLSVAAKMLTQHRERLDKRPSPSEADVEEAAAARDDVDGIGVLLAQQLHVAVLDLRGLGLDHVAHHLACAHRRVDYLGVPLQKRRHQPLQGHRALPAAAG
eukprot:366078-Chlamydomonas_euryale.AAC.12